ncbi:hypothetical protein Mapa_001283 [Marchantia paleacea]|nr:hypothetical protein Mapa_001283 [Marchantia paleacea]
MRASRREGRIDDHKRISIPAAGHEVTMATVSMWHVRLRAHDELRQRERGTLSVSVCTRQMLAGGLRAEAHRQPWALALVADRLTVSGKESSLQPAPAMCRFPSRPCAHSSSLPLVHAPTDCYQGSRHSTSVDFRSSSRTVTPVARVPFHQIRDRL